MVGTARTSGCPLVYAVLAIVSWGSARRSAASSASFGPQPMREWVISVAVLLLLVAVSFSRCPRGQTDGDPPCCRRSDPKRPFVVLICQDNPTPRAPSRGVLIMRLPGIDANLRARLAIPGIALLVNRSSNSACPPQHAVVNMSIFEPRDRVEF